ncbi:MAG: tRNA1(Val) (adenine(37)-N6)-methyltransferase [Oscillospiraceae bacterium]
MYEVLQGNFRLFISKTHKFGTDAFLLADFATSTANKKELALDLCGGCGIVGFLIYKTNVASQVYIIDIQKEATELTQQTIDFNNVNNKVVSLCGDLRTELKGYSNRFSLVTCNPPYKKAGTGLKCQSLAQTIARHEVMCTINDVCKVSSLVLKPGGRLCVCQRQDRLTDTIIAMQKNNIEPKRLRFVSHRVGLAPWLFLLEGKKGAKPYLKIEPSLFLEQAGCPTVEIQRIYRKC